MQNGTKSIIDETITEMKKVIEAKNVKCFHLKDENKSLHDRINNMLATHASFLNECTEQAEIIQHLEEEVLILVTEVTIKNEQVQEEREELLNSDETADPESTRADEAELQLTKLRIIEMLMGAVFKAL